MFLSRHVFNAGTFRLFQQLCPAVLVQASSIYSEEFLKINQFREKQQNLKQRLSKVKNNFHGINLLGFVFYYCSQNP